MSLSRREQALFDAIRRHFKVSVVCCGPQSQVGDFGEHLSDPVFYDALREISREVGREVRETDYVLDREPDAR